MLSKWFNTEQELKQGYVKSIWSFNMFMDTWIRNGSTYRDVVRMYFVGCYAII